MFIIVSVGLYNEAHIQACCRSVDEQTCKDWVHIIVTDKAPISFDSQQYKNKRVFIANSGQNGAAANIMYAIPKKNRGDDVVCLVDLDDTISNHALDIESEVFENNDVLLAYGSYIMASGKPGRFNGAYKEKEDIRLSPWRCSHLKAFRISLWNYFVTRYAGRLMDRKGKYLQTGSDIAIMMNLYELAGHDRTRHVSPLIYCYNDLNPNNDHKIRGKEQKSVERYIRNQKPLRRMP
jgi:hypothetical protein